MCVPFQPTTYQNASPKVAAAIFLKAIQNLNDQISDTRTTTTTTEDPCGPYEFLMTTVEIGGIGNQMSEYSTLLALSSMTGYTPRISQVRLVIPL